MTMDSFISKELKGRFEPIIMLRSNKKPFEAIQPKQNEHGCMMKYFAEVVVEGKTVVFDRNTCCCGGAVAGLGFGNGYTATSNSANCYAAFFTKGLQSAKDPEQYQAYIAKMDERSRNLFIEGEYLYSSSEDAYKWITEGLPIYDFPERYVVFKPLAALDKNEVPQSVIFTVNPLELTVLLMLTGSIPGGNKMAITPTPQSAACQVIGAHVFRQAELENPCAVLGLFDLSARLNTRKWIPDEYITYTAPWKLYLQLEEEAQNGIFQSILWKELISATDH